MGGIITSTLLTVLRLGDAQHFFVSHKLLRTRVRIQTSVLTLVTKLQIIIYAL